MEDTKMDGKSLDITKMNIEALKELFPDVVEEGKIDFDKLRIILGEEVDNNDERYNFTWFGKNDAIYKSQIPSTGTLRPYKNESEEWDSTDNLYIEGDNLEVLKLLQKSYRNSIKMIYIDPPYNTGNDFIYEDDFSDSIKNYKIMTKQIDAEGNSLKANSESDGRHHTKWLNLMYPRLRLARSLMRQDGIIFISIDDNEVTNLRKICDEIFGSDNFVSQIIIDGTPKNDPKIVSTSHEYCLVYVKNYNIAKTCTWGLPNPIYGQLIDIWEKSTDFSSVEEELHNFYSNNNLLNENISNYKYADEQGIYRVGPIDDPQGGGPKDERINIKTGNPLKIPSRGWSCNKKTWEEWSEKGLIYYPDSDDKLCAKKTYIDRDQLDLLRSYYKLQIRKDTDNLKRLFGGKKVFSFPKSLSFVSDLIKACTNDGDVIMDFFAGSSTTAHATLLTSKEESKKRNFILVQLPEDLEDNLKKATSNREKKILKEAIEYCSLNNYPLKLTEIGKERIRLARKELKLDSKSNNQTKLFDTFAVDSGFRVFKLDESNIKKWIGDSEDIQTTLSSYVDNFRTDDGRTDEDIIYEILLKLGLSLTTKVESNNHDNPDFYIVGYGALMICLKDVDSTSIADKMIKWYKDEKPEIWNVVFRDSGFITDSIKANVKETLKSAGLKEDSFITI